MSVHSYDKGALVRCRGSFTSRELAAGEENTFRLAGTLPAGVGLDPTTVVFRSEAPDGTEVSCTYPTDPELVKQAVGSYYVDLDANASDVWVYRFEAAGAGQSADERRFVVEESAF